MRVWVGMAVAALTTVLATSCAAAEVTPATVTVTPDSTASRAPVVSPPADPVPEVVWPLTGLDASDAPIEELGKMAISIKIPNDPSHSRPQKNLEYADIVFEEYVESGIPRLVAVFQTSHPETVGPVRSMRDMDPNIVGSFGGPLVFSGANAAVLKNARNTGQLLIAEDVGSSGFFRTKDRAAPYNLHIRLADVVAQAVGTAAPAQQFAYAYPAEDATAAATGTPASRIDLRFSGYGEPKWDWDATTGTWLRTEFSDPHVTVDGTRISASNVVVLFVSIHMTLGLPVSEMIVTNSPGYVASGGKYIPILWSKADRTAPYVITTEAGEPVTLAPGQTWIELIPNAGVSGGHAKFS